MSLNELLDLIGIDEPDEFEYFENFADIVESDEEIPEETLAELFRSTDPETVSEIIEQYYDDIMNVVSTDHPDIYALLDTIRNVLIALILADDDEDESIDLFAEELIKFHTWYSFESAVDVTEMGEDIPTVHTLKDAITVMRIGKLDNEEHICDFSGCTDYEIDDYILDLASESRDRRMEDPNEDYLEHGYVYDN